MKIRLADGIVWVWKRLTLGSLAFLLGMSFVIHGAEPDLAGLWGFDEGRGAVTVDASGSGETATVQGANWVEGASGFALSFDGKGDYVDCGSRSRLDVGTGDFSVQAWIWTTSAETNDMIVGRRGAAGQPHWSLFIEDGRARAYVNSGGDSKHADWAVGSTPVVDGKWHHVAGVVDRGSGKIMVYVDGRLDGSAAIARIPEDTSLDNGGHILIGARDKNGLNAFPGTIDAVALHRGALTPAQIGVGRSSTRRAGTGMTSVTSAPAVPLRSTHRTPQDKTGRGAIRPLPRAAGRAGAGGTQGIRFGITADPHARMNSQRSTQYLNRFVDAMIEWQPDFTIDLGDFAIQMKEGATTQEMHDWQLENLKYQCSLLSRLPCPRYFAMGNHCVGWLKGGDEILQPEALIGHSHGGEDITKLEFLAQTGMAHRYYSFALDGWLFIALDGNNWRGTTAVAPGHDGIDGAYWIDDTQKAWVTALLEANRDKRKIVFCHEELHHTPVEGSGHGGDSPFPAIGKERSYVDNGWELRQLFAKDGKVIACFFGHKHDNRWTVYDGVHYITLAATHRDGSFAKVTLSEQSEQLVIEGAGKQRSYTLPLQR